MAVDLRSNTMFSRISLVLMDDCLIKLEHARTEDRIRKFMFDAIESVVIWRRIPWVRVILCAVLLGVPGIAVLFFNNTFTTVTGSFLLALAAFLLTWYLYHQNTTIRIVRSGKNYDLTGVFRRGKVMRLKARLVAGIRAAQRAPGTSLSTDALTPPAAESLT